MFTAFQITSTTGVPACEILLRDMELAVFMVLSEAFGRLADQESGQVKHFISYQSGINKVSSYSAALSITP
jgi:hypothetical protein